jgi:membrane-associated phospholipid phosphatase
MDIIIRIMADGLVIPIILVGALVLLIKVPRGKRFESYSRVVMAGLTTYLIAKLAAQVYQPSFERPFQLMGTAAGALYLNNPGFPSDHALFVSAITLAVWFETKIKWISLLLAIGVVLVCVGRVVALVHTPLDVIAGVAIALVGSLWYIQGKNKTVGVKIGKKVTE